MSKAVLIIFIVAIIIALHFPPPRPSEPNAFLVHHFNLSLRSPFMFMPTVREADWWIASDSGLKLSKMLFLSPLPTPFQE